MTKPNSVKRGINLDTNFEKYKQLSSVGNLSHLTLVEFKRTDMFLYVASKKCLEFYQHKTSGYRIFYIKFEDTCRKLKL